MKKTVLLSVLAIMLPSLLPSCLFSQSQNYFALGLWYVATETPYPGYISDHEKGLFNNVKNTWLIGLQAARERHYMNFCNETGGRIRMPILGDCEYPELVPNSWHVFTRAPVYYTDCSGVARYCPSYPNPQFINNVNAWIDAVAARYNSDVGFQEYGVGREVYPQQYWQNIKYICDRIQQVNDAHSSLLVGNVSAYSNPELFFDTVTSLDIFQHEHYPFGPNTPYTGQVFQDSLDALVSSTRGYGRCMTIFRERHTKWHAIIQASQIWDEPGHTLLNRLPTRSEIKVQAYLALSRGARGIEYFTYWTGTNGDYSYDGHVTQGSPRNPYDYGDRYGETSYKLYDVVSSLNNDLAEIGPIMLDLYPVAAFPSTNIPPESYIKSVTGNYIDVGTFTDEKHQSDPDANLDYFMVVNRACSRDESGNPADPQNITVTIQKQPNTKYVFREMLSGTETIVVTDANGRYTYPVTLGPGEGKLIMLRRIRRGVATANQTWHCTEYVSGDVTFNSGHTLTIEPGTTVKFIANTDDQGGGLYSTKTELIINGVLNATGTSTNRITFTSSSATPAAGQWGGIRINAGATESKVDYCDIQYATTGLDIQYTGAQNRVHVYKSNIRNNSGHGISVYNGVVGATVHPSISYCYIRDNRGASSAGIYTYKSSPSVSHTRIENNTWGIYSVYGGSPTISNCKVSLNQNGGIVAAYSGTAPYIWLNTFTYNNDVGYYTYGNGVWAYFSGYVRHSYPGRNLLDHNEGNGLRASGATIKFGTASPWEPGYHQITQNSLDSYPNWQAYTESGGHIDACVSYWNPELWSGDVNASPTLNSPPTDPPAGWGHPDDWDPTQDGGGGLASPPSPPQRSCYGRSASIGYFAGA